jgi:hypothetical protein
MLMGPQTVLDWTTAGTITRRFETFLKDKTAAFYNGVTGGSSTLATAKDLRNHIAHNSDESAIKFKKVLDVIYPTPPLVLPTPGALLASTPTSGPARGRQVLTYFRERFSQIGASVTAAHH